MKPNKKALNRELIELTSAELLELYLSAEANRISDEKRFKVTLNRLKRAQMQLNTQKIQLEKYRKKITELTYPHGHNL